MMFWDHADQFSWWYVLMPLSMVAFWGVVAWVIVMIVRGDRRSDLPSAQPGPPTSSSYEGERILAERYARGDIDTEEYTKRRDTLHAHSPQEASRTG
jgi:putative membrane protein